MILLYIDPGTGSMLFTILLGVFGAVVFFFRGFVLKLKLWLGSRNHIQLDENKLPIVIYSDHKRYWTIFEPVCREFEKMEQPVVYMTQSEDDPGLNSGFKFVKGQYIGAGNKGFSVLNILNATVVLSTTPGLDVYQWKRSRNVDYYVHMFHGVSNASFYKMFGLDYYDAVLLSGEFQKDVIRKLEDLRNIPHKEFEYTGIPYLDAMVERYKKSEQKKTAKREAPLVLLAPSWGPNAILAKYGSEFIDHLIETGYDLVIRPHPQSYTADRDIIKKLKEKYPDGEKLTWNSDNDNFDILAASDIMISDYSGVIWDYTLVFDKPIIYTQPDFDRSTYDCAWLEEEPWVLRTLPTIGRQISMDNIDRIKEIIDDCLTSDAYATGRQHVKDEAWMCMGEGARLTAEYVVKKYKELTENEKDTDLRSV